MPSIKSCLINHCILYTNIFQCPSHMYTNKNSKAFYNVFWLQKIIISLKCTRLRVTNNRIFVAQDKHSMWLGFYMSVYMMSTEWSGVYVHKNIYIFRKKNWGKGSLTAMSYILWQWWYTTHRFAVFF